ncbi:hypothetical protein [Sorangium sp. So ce1151]|uniref:hypothetical protein n=1 Tax=Sorangium sp. So ce1151 TaxID=3133332 RepID=UPI003F6487CF
MSTGSGKDELEPTEGTTSVIGTEQTDQTQIPIDAKLRFLDARTSGPLIHVAVTGSTPPSGYAPKAEYWSRRDAVKADIMTLESTTFTNRPGSAGYPKEFTDWIAGGNVLATAQEASAQEWLLGIYQPTAPINALYWAADPDAPSTNRIGLLVECGPSSELLNVIWYKMTQPQNGLIFQKVPSKLTFTKVYVNSAPSTDPRAIDPQASWYFYHGTMRLL